MAQNSLQRISVIAGLVLVFSAWADTKALAQTMDFSTYHDEWTNPDADTLEAYISYYDGSTGCSHTGHWIDSYMSGPTGTVYGGDFLTLPFGDGDFTVEAGFGLSCNGPLGFCANSTSYPVAYVGVLISAKRTTTYFYGGYQSGTTCNWTQTNCSSGTPTCTGQAFATYFGDCDPCARAEYLAIQIGVTAPWRCTYRAIHDDICGGEKVCT